MISFIRIFLLVFTVVYFTSVKSQNWAKIYADSANFALNEGSVDGRKYIAFCKGSNYYVVNSKNDTIIKKAGDYYTTEFSDFNKDGYKDIIVDIPSHPARVLGLFLYDPSTRKFKEVKAFREFPDPQPIKGTEFFYSYHKSGCADMNWDSDLFYIADFKAIRIGNIAGRQCGSDGDQKEALYIYQVNAEKKKLFKTMPIDILIKYKDYKWGFIEQYWKKNYRLFGG